MSHPYLWLGGILLLAVTVIAVVACVAESALRNEVE